MTEPDGTTAVDVVRERLVDLVHDQLREIRGAAMPERQTWEVAPHGDQWAVTHQGASRATELFDRKEDAMVRGMELAKGAAPHGQLIIKRADGTIEDERTYGNDPNPPKG